MKDQICTGLIHNGNSDVFGLDPSREGRRGWWMSASKVFTGPLKPVTGTYQPTPLSFSIIFILLTHESESVVVSLLSDSQGSARTEVSSTFTHFAHS